MRGHLPFGLVAVAISISATGCTIVRVEDPSLTSATLSPEEEHQKEYRAATEARLADANKRFADARRAVENAETKAASPADAEKEHFVARALVLKTLRGLKSTTKERGHSLDSIFGEATRLARLGDVGYSDSDSTVALELLWRTFIGRTAALRALKRDAETLADAPRFETDGSECKGDLRARCVGHLAWLKTTHPHAFKTEEDRNGRMLTHRSLHELDSADTPTFFNEWVDTKQKGFVVARISPSAIKKHPKGGYQLVIESEDIGYSYGSDCKKVLKTSGGQPVVEDGRLVVQERCAERGTAVAKGRTIRFVTAAVPERLLKPFTPETKLRVDIAVDMSTVRKSANDREYTLGGAIIVGATEKGDDVVVYGALL